MLLPLRTVHRRVFGLILGAFLLSLSRLLAALDFAPGQVLVRFADKVDPRAIESMEHARGLKKMKQFSQHVSGARRGPLILYSHAGRSTAQLKTELLNEPNVVYAEPNYIRYYSSLPNDTDFGQLWALHNTGQSVNGTSGTSDADIDYPRAWQLSRHPSSEVVVGVADSGMSLQHPDLNGNLWTNPAEIANNGIDDDGNGYTDDVHGYDFGTDTHQMVDNNNHGTHVAGTIGALSNNATGIVGVHGSVCLLPLKVEAANGSLYTADIIEAFLYAVNLRNSGVNLVAVNASFGGPSFTQAEYDVIADMHSAGIILCAAAGNESVDNDNVASYPANYDLPNILSVAATDPNNALASFSNYGSTTVDLAAPGVNIYSTLPLNFINHTTGLTAGGSGYSAITLEHGGTTDESGISGNVIACGLGYPGDFPGTVSGNIALIKRGVLNFSEKLVNAMDAGAIGVLIYNYEKKPPQTWTLGYEAAWIPALQLTNSVGEDILAQLPLSATVTNTSDLTTAYQFLNGTSMATPHVTGAVAFAALNFPDDTLSQRIGRILNNVTPVAALSGVVSTGGVLNLQMLVDSDDDALGDWWEEDHFGDLSDNGSRDSDGDGQSNANEFASRTDPTSGSSRFRLNSIDLDPLDGASIQFQSVAGLNYQVLWRESLNTGTWQILETDLAGDGTVIEITDPEAANADQRFYRLSLLE